MILTPSILYEDGGMTLYSTYVVSNCKHKTRLQAVMILNFIRSKKLFLENRTYTKMNVIPGAYSGGGTKTVGMFAKLMSTASEFAMEVVKNLVVKKHVSCGNTLCLAVILSLFL